MDSLLGRAEGGGELVWGLPDFIASGDEGKACSKNAISLGSILIVSDLRTALTDLLEIGIWRSARYSSILVMMHSALVPIEREVCEMLWS